MHGISGITLELKVEFPQMNLLPLSSSYGLTVVLLNLNTSGAQMCYDIAQRYIRGSEKLNPWF